MEGRLTAAASPSLVTHHKFLFHYQYLGNSQPYSHLPEQSNVYIFISTENRKETASKTTLKKTFFELEKKHSSQGRLTYQNKDPS